MFVKYIKRKFSLSKNSFNKGKSMKIFAEELGGKDFISANYYLTKQGGVLKPCEMAEEKVINFLTNFKEID
ncbi:MAG: peptide methionine sulfoxide reductase [Bacteroidota bacterium]